MLAGALMFVPGGKVAKVPATLLTWPPGSVRHSEGSGKAASKTTQDNNTNLFIPAAQDLQELQAARERNKGTLRGLCDYN